MKIVISGMNNGKPVTVKVLRRHKYRTFTLEHDSTQVFPIIAGESLSIVGACCVRNDGPVGAVRIVRNNCRVTTLCKGEEYYALEPYKRAKSITLSVVA